ncbi:MAG: class I SAM-dependent methyltransferase [Myxococcota bacterium]
MSESGLEAWQGQKGQNWAHHIDGLERLLEPVNAPWADSLRLDSARRIVDLACGGGGSTRTLRDRSPRGAVVDGFDVSQELVELASSRLASRGVRVRHANIASREPPDGPYDRVGSRFGVMFFDEPLAAFRNLRRWMSEGGCFSFAVWAESGANPWAALVREVVAEVASSPPPEPDTPGLFRYGSVEKLSALLTAAGFSKLKHEVWRGVLPLGGSAEEAAHFALSAFWDLTRVLSAAGESTTREAQRRLTERLREFEADGAVRMGATVHLVSGQG